MLSNLGIFDAFPQVRPSLLFSSVSTVLHYVNLAFPRLRLPSRVFNLSLAWNTKSAVFHLEFGCILSMTFSFVTTKKYLKQTRRVHNRFGGMRDLAYFEGEIRDAS